MNKRWKKQELTKNSDVYYKRKKESEHVEKRSKGDLTNERITFNKFKN